MDFWNSLFGTIRVRITSAAIESTVKAINAWGISLFKIKYVNDLCVEATIKRNQYSHLQKGIDKRGDKLEILFKSGLIWSIISLKKRPVLLIGFVLYLVFTLYLPTRVLFIQVEGNQTVPTEIIMEHADNIGISFGAARKSIRSEQIKNALLAAVPQLQWAGVNTRGCIAIISVRERNIQPERNTQHGVSSIVAKRDGIIQELIVTRGNVLCKIGQAVKTGQILVSGYTDCGISIKATAAEAEIYARTSHNLAVTVPIKRTVRLRKTNQKTKFSILVGKNLIKLYKDSGISDARCVKMYSENYLTLPGNFQLPIAFVKETEIYYDTQSSVSSEDDTFSWVEAQAEEYLKENMVAGKILYTAPNIYLQEDVVFLEGTYSCLEMIGQNYSEEIIKGNE